VTRIVHVAGQPARITSNVFPGIATDFIVNFADYTVVLDRVAGTTALLDPNERASAERVVALCHELQARARESGRVASSAADFALKRELGRLTETLGRRGSRALPAATLARAALADLSGDVNSFRLLCADCDAKLTLFGW
jgi:hypothetical protein